MAAEANTEPVGISRITVSGYKCFLAKTWIDIRPLTVLAGANSSGKSSIMEPLLLLKQTWNAPYEADSLHIAGPNVVLSRYSQMRPTVGGEPRTDELRIRLDVTDGRWCGWLYRHRIDRTMQLEETWWQVDGPERRLRVGMSPQEIRDESGTAGEGMTALAVAQQRASLVVRYQMAAGWGYSTPAMGLFQMPGPCILHLPGLRGSPQRAYPHAGVPKGPVGLLWGFGVAGTGFAGPFPYYVASLILAWRREEDSRYVAVGSDLRSLGLTAHVEAEAVDDTRIGLRVSRRAVAHGAAEDMVGLPDVGLGVSQVLPVVVALLAAEPGQLVYIEQPETHLHPRAQDRLADLLVKAAKRGVRVVIETHSAMLLLAIQARVAEGKIGPSDVALHWFTRKRDGFSRVDTADLDAAGRFGDWPEDFGSVELRALSRYYDAANERLAEASDE